MFTKIVRCTRPVSIRRRAELGLEQLDQRILPNGTPVSILIGDVSQVVVSRSTTMTETASDGSGSSQTSSYTDVNASNATTSKYVATDGTVNFSTVANQMAATQQGNTSSRWSSDMYSYTTDALRTVRNFQSTFDLTVSPDGAVSQFMAAHWTTINESQTGNGWSDPGGYWDYTQTQKTATFDDVYMSMDRTSDGLISTWVGVYHAGNDVTQYAGSGLDAYGPFSWSSTFDTYNVVGRSSSDQELPDGNQHTEGDTGYKSQNETHFNWYVDPNGQAITSTYVYGDYAGISHTDVVDKFFDGDTARQNLTVKTAGDSYDSNRLVENADGTASSYGVHESTDEYSANYVATQSGDNGPRDPLYFEPYNPLSEPLLQNPFGYGY